MNITIEKEITTAGVNTLQEATLDGKPVLLIGLKATYREKPQYERDLRRQYERCKEFDYQYLMKMTALEEIDGQGPCIVLEREAGRTLDAYIKEGHTEEEYHSVAVQLAEALDYIHRNGAVHGMVCPQMIYITQQGDQVRLVPFRLYLTDALMESRAVSRYVAPEAEDGTVALDARADIFALGQILKDMQLTLPYSNVISCATSFARSERYIDVESFLADFDHRRSVSKGSPRSMIYVLAAIVVCLVIGAVIIFMKSRSEGSAPSGEPATEMADSTQQSDTLTQQSAAPQPVDTASQMPTANTVQGVQDQPDFLTSLVPQMHVDIDKIFQPLTVQGLSPDAKAAVVKQVNTRLTRYYKGLMRSIRNSHGALSTEDQAAFDKAYLDYVNAKKAQLMK